MSLSPFEIIGVSFLSPLVNIQKIVSDRCAVSSDPREIQRLQTALSQITRNNNNNNTTIGISPPPPLTRQYGVTKSISELPATTLDISETRELEQLIKKWGQEEQEDSLNCKIEFLGLLDSWVQEFARDLLLQKCLVSSEQIVDKSVVALYTFGSFRQQVTVQDSDIDCLLVGPSGISREEMFDGLEARLRLIPSVTKISKTMSARVPLMSFLYNDIEVDILYAHTWLPIVQAEHINLLDDKILSNLDEASVLSMGGSRSTDLTFDLLPPQQLDGFRTAIRFIKYWAKQRGIYSHMHGYLGGISWVLLVARICQLFPNASASTLVRKFFHLFSVWKWSSPIMLKEIIDIHIKNIEVWDPRKRSRDLMAILTPAYPAFNSSHNVSMVTLPIIQREFVRGHRICTANDNNIWEQLVEPTPFFSDYTMFLGICISSQNEEHQKLWKGWVESRARNFVKSLGDSFSQHLEICPHPRVFSDPAQLHTDYIFIGLKACKWKGKGETRPVCNVTDNVNRFCEEMIYKCPTYQDGMKLIIQQYKKSDLPLFVFPNSIRPAAAGTKKRARE